MVEIQALEASVCWSFLTLPQPTIVALDAYGVGDEIFLAVYYHFRIIPETARLDARK